MPRPRLRPSFANNPLGRRWPVGGGHKQKRMTNPMTKILVALALTLLATEALAQSPSQNNIIGTCVGILHLLTPRLWVGSAKAEIAEDLPCFIAQSEVKRVLSICAIGRWCEVAGVIDGNCEPGKCEISRVTSVSRTKKR